jgi:hypothetical protein
VQILSRARKHFFAFPDCHRAVILLVALALVLPAAASFAAPDDDIKAAIVAGGAPDISHAPRDIFVRGFTAVALRVKQRDLPDYVAAAIQMRPDLTRKIVAAAIKVMARQDRGFTCAAFARMISVAVAANPEYATTIAKAAIQARPELASCIIDAASKAAPEQRSQIAKLETNFSLTLVSLVISDPEMERWHGVGTLNPANVLDFRPENPVVSPEQPPASR